MKTNQSNEPQKMPPGIPYIIGNEAAERFSFYGMKTILIIFMTNYLMMSENKATIWMHTFLMAAYFLPIVGGVISDIFWGKYATIIRLSLFYCLGHAVLAIYESELTLAIGLGLIAVGAGGIKSCVSAHVGDQFDKTNSSLLERVFSFFYISINLGAFISTLLTPLLMKVYGPAVAFGVPGVLMFLATWLFWLGRNKFIAIPAVGWEKFRSEVFSKNGIRIILKLSGIYIFLTMFWALFDQTGSTWVLQAKRALMDKNIDLGFVNFTLLPDQIQAMNPFLILILSLLFSYVIYPALSRFFKLTYMRKIAAGFFISVLSFVVIAWIEGNMEAGQTVHVSWQLLAFFIITVAEVLVSITALEFSYTQAPNSMKSFVMGMFWLTVTIGNFITTGVNNLIVRDAVIEEITTGGNTFIRAENMEGIADGLKIELEEVKGVSLIQQRAGRTDTVKLSGTFIIANTDTEKKSFEILDIDKNAVATLASSQTDFPQDMQVNKLKGSGYFMFFVYLMLGTAILFLPVAWWYKEEKHIQEFRK